MARKILVVLLALALSACATTNGPSASNNDGGATRSSGPTASASGWALSILGTPFAFVMKTLACGATLVVAAPAAGFLTLGVDPYGQGYQVLGDGIAANCGGSYVVSPYAAS
jgi:uncharacterized protein YceK